MHMALSPTPPKIELKSVAALRPYAGNARRHSKRQIKQIADSITRFGFTNPVLISDDDEIVAGHGRVLAAKQLGIDAVPILKLSHLSAAERRAYVLADNKLALNAGWDVELLGIELQGLIDLDFDVSLTGFSLAEIDLVLDGVAFHQDAALARDMSPEGIGKKDKQYPGPSVPELNDDLVEAFIEYLEERGVNDSFAEFMELYAFWMEQQEYEAWLSQVAEFAA